MKNVGEMDIGELAAYVCSHLYSQGIKCVLSGGACVSIYSDNRYQSQVIDFIENSSTPRKLLTEALSKIGFYEENRYYKHEQTELFIEFPAGPLSIGSEPVRKINEITFSTGKLFLLNPTDSVKDRLCAYYFWDDYQSLEQAIMLSRYCEISIEEIERWSIAEGMIEKFKEYRDKTINI